jgi:hypothetical protein
LINNGFRSEDVSILMPQNVGTKDFKAEKNTKAPEGTAAGAIAGGAIGGTLGLLAGIGVPTIPGLGPFIAAGPIMGALAGIGSGGVVGVVIGALVGMGIPEYEAKRYEGLVREGGILVSVHWTTPSGWAAPRTSWSVPVPPTLLPLARTAPIMPQATSRAFVTVAADPLTNSRVR